MYHFLKLFAIWSIDFPWSMFVFLSTKMLQPCWCAAIVPRQCGFFESAAFFHWALLMQSRSPRIKCPMTVTISHPISPPVHVGMYFWVQKTREWMEKRMPLTRSIELFHLDTNLSPLPKIAAKRQLHCHGCSCREGLMGTEAVSHRIRTCKPRGWIAKQDYLEVSGFNVAATQKQRLLAMDSLGWELQRESI